MPVIIHKAAIPDGQADCPPEPVNTEAWFSSKNRVGCAYCRERTIIVFGVYWWDLSSKYDEHSVTYGFRYVYVRLVWTN